MNYEESQESQGFAQPCDFCAPCDSFQIQDSGFQILTLIQDSNFFSPFTENIKIVEYKKMFIPVDLDSVVEKQKEIEVHVPDSAIVQYISDYFKTRYLDTIKDPSGNSIPVQSFDADQADSLFRMYDYKTLKMSDIADVFTQEERDKIRNWGITLMQELNGITTRIEFKLKEFLIWQKEQHPENSKLQRMFFQMMVREGTLSKKLYHQILYAIPYMTFPDKMEILVATCAAIDYDIGQGIKAIKQARDGQFISEQEYEILKNILLDHDGEFHSLLDQSNDNTLSEFQAHPAYNFAVQHKSHIENVLQTNTDIAQYYDLDKKRQREEIIFLIAENLFHKGITQNIDDTIIEECIQDFLQFRHKYEDMTLFEDRNVLLIASNEERLEEDERGEDQHTGEFRFGQEKTIKMMKKQADDFDILRPADLSMKTAKEELKQKIINAPKNTTFVFAGHGGTWKNGSISFGEYKESKKIDWFIFDTDEMVDAFVERYQKHNNISKDNPDIIIFSSCYNNNIYHRFIEILKQKMPNAPLPIGVLPAEFGQVLIDTDTQYDHDIFLNLEKKYGEKHDIKLKDIFDIEFDPHTPDNPSIYIPHQGNIQKIAVNLDKSPNLES